MSEILSADPRADVNVLTGWVAALGSLNNATDDAERVDQLRLLEELKSAAAAAQARVAVDFDASQRQAQQDAGVPARELGRGIAAQVGLARRDGPVKGARHLGLAKALVHEMPRTLTALRRGEISEWRATLVVRETACLSREDRGTVDAELAARPGGLTALGDAATAAETRRIAYRLDPHAFTRRASKAAADRCVTIRPAPDTMTYLTGLLPVTQGVAVHAALTRQANTLRSDGDERSRGQIMADTLVERVTGQATAAAVPVEVNLVMTDEALLADDAAPVQVEGYGPVPAPLARTWLHDSEAEVWVRRLYSAPDRKTLVAMDSVRRAFRGKLRRFIEIRDQVCRTQWCDAPVRHVDHPQRVTDGGETSAANGQGLCEACNYAKEAIGWRARADAGGVVETTTPTGHVYRSHPPRPPGTSVPRAGSRQGPSRIEVFFRDVILVA